MIQNIILIILIILLFFFISNEKKLNDLFTKKYIKYLFILLIIYFIYQQYNLSILVIALLIVIGMNVDLKNKFSNYENYKNIIVEYYNNFSKEHFSDRDDYNVKPYKATEESKESKESNEISETNKSESIEPFKTEVIKLKDLYENIKLEIKKLK